MFCTKCGSNNPNNSAFCLNCGQPLNAAQAPPQQQMAPPPPPKPKKPAKKSAVLAWIFGALSLLLAAALVVVLVVPGIIPATSGGASGSISARGFSTPDDAIEYFIDRINDGDVEGAMAASAVPFLVENADYEAMVERLQAITPQTFMPTEYDFYRMHNQAHFQAQLLNQIRGMVLSLTYPEYAEVYLSFQMLPLDTEKADYKGVDPTLDGDIKVLDIDEPMEEMYNSDKNRENMRKMTKAYGADDMEWRAVLYEYDGDYYVGGFQLLEYDGSYYILAANEMMIGQSPSGALMPVNSQSDFEDYTE